MLNFIVALGLFASPAFAQNQQQLTLELCIKLLQALTQPQAAPAVLTMRLNPVALKMRDLANQGQLLNQRDQRLAPYFNGNVSQLCVPTSFYNIFLATEALAGRADNVGPQVWFPVFLASYKFSGDQKVMSQLASVFGVNPGYLSLPGHYDGRFGAITAEFVANSALHVKGMGFTSYEIGLTYNPESALETALQQNGLAMGVVQGFNLNHAVVVLGIDTVNKQILISNPENPNEIVPRPYLVQYENGSPVIQFQLGNAIVPLWATLRWAYFLQR